MRTDLPMYQHLALEQMRDSHPDWIWHRSDTHVMLGVPGSLEGLKTIVEPGNAFSPGAGTFGVTAWVFDHQKDTLYAPETMPLADIDWSFVAPGVPVLISKWRADDIAVTSRLFTDGDLAQSDVKTYLTLTVTNISDAPRDISLYLVIRSFGAAGGPISHLGMAGDGRAVDINHFPLLYFARTPTHFGAVSYTDTEQDISDYLRRGEMPRTATVEDASSWASGALEYRLSLPAGGEQSFEFFCPVKANHRLLTWLKPPESFPSLVQLEQAFCSRWQTGYTLQVDVPDPRFTEAFYAQLAHLSMFTVADAPRICPISYPIWWLRDGSYVVQALDKGGLQEFAGRACLGIKDQITFGGFGSEGDGPADAIWMLTEHFLLTHDRDYLLAIYPGLLEKAELLMRMRRATSPIKMFTEYVGPDFVTSPVTDLFCAPAKDGLIQGRMDWHYPVFWINGFAHLAFQRIAHCAWLMHDDARAAQFEAEAASVRSALLAEMPRTFGQNSRDINSALWPTGWAFDADCCLAEVKAQFEHFWQTERCPNGVYTREPLWTYFEAGQLHNLLWLGERDKVWQGLEAFFTEHTAPGLYTYHEGNGDENSFDQWQRTRGWDHIRYVTPHGWTAAELLLLLRDCLLYEQGDTLVLGAGVPPSWLSGPAAFGISHAPSHFGEVSWRYEPATSTLSIAVEYPPTGGVSIRFAGEEIRRDVVWEEKEGMSETEIRIPPPEGGG